MEAARLDRATVERLAAAPLTYPTTLGGRGGAPDGFASFTRTADLGPVDFAATADALMRWQVQLRSGVRVAASSPTAQVGSVVVLRLGVGPLAVRAPCRVVRVVDEPTRKGFAYGTMPGHPEAGEESFNGRRPRRRAGHAHDLRVLPPRQPTGPSSRSRLRAVQRAITRRYLRALTVS